MTTSITMTPGHVYTTPWTTTPTGSRASALVIDDDGRPLSYEMTITTREATDTARASTSWRVEHDDVYRGGRSKCTHKAQAACLTAVAEMSGPSVDEIREDYQRAIERAEETIASMRQAPQLTGTPDHTTKRVPTPAERLSRVLTQQGITQAQAGREIGVSGKCVGLWARGDTHPQADNAHALYAWLALREAQPRPQTIDLDELLS